MKKVKQFNKRLILLLIVASINGTNFVNCSENVPRMPFAIWANLPQKGQIRISTFYQESEAYHMWAKDDYYNITWKKPDGERYGIDITQGFISLEYGITERWAIDVNLGYTTVGWRYFANYGPSGKSQSTSGLMDSSVGIRYQVFTESSPGRLLATPLVTFRAGGILPGSFDKNFPFAPGNRSAGIEPALFIKKHWGWEGFGTYTDIGFRWNRTTSNDQLLLGIGVFQQVKGWELAVGYRRLHSVSGDDIQLYPDRTIFYPRTVREIYDAVEAGFSYTTPVRKICYGFWSRVVVDGSNTDGKFWLGGYVSVPFQLIK